MGCVTLRDWPPQLGACTLTACWRSRATPRPSSEGSGLADRAHRLSCRSIWMLATLVALCALATARTSSATAP